MPADDDGYEYAVAYADGVVRPLVSRSAAERVADQDTRHPTKAHPVWIDSARSGRAVPVRREALPWEEYQ